MNSVLKWVGGKRFAQKSLLEAWKTSGARRLVEPFAGAATLTFAAEPAEGVLGDTCSPLMDFYAVLKDYCGDLTRGFSRLISTPPTEKRYYSLRDQYNKSSMASLTAAVERSARFLYFNRVAYHGLWRVNSRGEMNVGYGHYAHPRFATASELHAASQVIKNTVLCSASFGGTFDKITRGDFVYCDPPYVDTFDGYSTRAFTAEDHRRLADLSAHALRKTGAFVVLSNRDHPLVRKLYPERWWKWLHIGVRQSIAPQNGGKHAEVILIGRT